jgi:hypothetical protein
MKRIFILICILILITGCAAPVKVIEDKCHGYCDSEKSRVKETTTFKDGTIKCVCENGLFWVFNSTREK